MNRFTILILFCSSVAFAQENSDRLRPGVQVSSVFSSDYDHGISPALTLNYRRWMFTAGPTFTYDRIFEKKSSFYKRNQQVILELASRYYLLPDTKRVRPFAQLGVSYKYEHVIYEMDYRGGLQLPYGSINDYDFLGEWNHRKNTFSTCGSFGVDVRIWKQLSFFASAGAGTSFEWGKSRLTNVETGVTENFYRTREQVKLNLIASAGLGYRF